LRPATGRYYKLISAAGLVIIESKFMELLVIKENWRKIRQQ